MYESVYEIRVNLWLNSYSVFFRVGVSAVRRDDVEDPAEQTASPTPEEESKQQPHDSRQNAAVINLAETWHK